MKKITKRITNYIKDILGITKLENKIFLLENKNKSICYKLESHSRWLNESNSDYKLILGHVRFLNDQFFVASDINHSKHAPSVVLIMHRGKKEIVKSYTFNNKTVEEIHRMLEGFGKHNNHIDQPIGFPNPRFRY
ncbi:hypothetical protein GON26_01200 [Flavobacterium sp. GA093]|uniref:Uncharacterized protein n=1 Tax=Flavobacterium hydrocarbonoxydans TaxID=2683249 RepID=A0A6I4NEC8_9FLAO|nr:hypothetical protein [Flavobacterium hydrocarbonoxydans]MWB92966.1 hypothetical protein [Flavobacterium hydrocarbonoxydans]